MVRRLALVAMTAAVVTPWIMSAQEAGPGGPPPPPRHEFGGGPPMGGFPMGHMQHKVVSGLPYSADVTTTMNQTLADGNAINRTETGHVARDGQGRVYMQQNISGGPWAQKGATTITFLSDPVAGYTYVLNAKDKVAMRREFHPHDDAGAPPPPPPGNRGGQANDRVEADLGQQTIGGLLATGKSITRTLPAGEIGNTQALVEKTEIWTSPDLQVVVSSTHSDPRMGKTTYALSNIQRAEPNAALFQVPSDYTIKDAPTGGPRGH